MRSAVRYCSQSAARRLSGVQLNIYGLLCIRKNGKPKPWQQLLESAAGDAEREASFLLRKFPHVIEGRHEGFLEIRLVKIDHSGRIR